MVKEPALWRVLLSWLVLLPLLFFSTGEDLSFAPGNVALRETAAQEGSLTHRIPLALFTFLCLILVLSAWPAVFALCRRMKVILALPLLALASAAWSQAPRETLTTSLVLLVFTLFAFFVSTRFEARRQLSLILMIGSVAVPVSILLAVLVPGIGATAEGWRGIFGHKNACSAISVLFMVAALHWEPRSSLQRLFRPVFVVLNLLLIGMSRSRGGWALCLVALALTGILRLLRRLASLEAVLTVLAAVPVLGVSTLLVAQQSGRLLSAVGKDVTLSERTIIWAAAWHSIVKHVVLGYGYAGFWTGLRGESLNVILVSGWLQAQAQDGFLDLWLQVGMAGIAILVLMLGQAAVDASNGFRAGLSENYVRWAIVTIVCVIMYNIGESAIAVTNITWFLFLLACIGLRITARSVRNKIVV